MKRRVVVVLTTRGNYAKMKSTMRAVGRHPRLELAVVVGGGILLPRYGDYVARIEEDGFRVDRRVQGPVLSPSREALGRPGPDVVPGADGPVLPGDEPGNVQQGRVVSGPYTPDRPVAFHALRHPPRLALSHARPR